MICGCEEVAGLVLGEEERACAELGRCGLPDGSQRWVTGETTTTRGFSCSETSALAVERGGFCGQDNELGAFIEFREAAD